MTADRTALPRPVRLCFCAVHPVRHVDDDHRRDAAEDPGEFPLELPDGRNCPRRRRRGLLRVDVRRRLSGEALGFQADHPARPGADRRRTRLLRHDARSRGQHAAERADRPRPGRRGSRPQFDDPAHGRAQHRSADERFAWRFRRRRDRRTVRGRPAAAERPRLGRRLPGHGGDLRAAGRDDGVRRLAARPSESRRSRAEAPND